MKNLKFYYVEDWDTEEIIAQFLSEEERQEWLDRNTIIKDGYGYLKDGTTKVSIYEI